MAFLGLGLDLWEIPQASFSTPNIHLDSCPRAQSKSKSQKTRFHPRPKPAFVPSRIFDAKLTLMHLTYKYSLSAESEPGTLLGAWEIRVSLTKRWTSAVPGQECGLHHLSQPVCSSLIYASRLHVGRSIRSPSSPSGKWSYFPHHFIPSLKEKPLFY